MTTATLQKTAKDLESFVKAGKRKLFEFETLRSAWDVKNGKGKSYKSARAFMRHIKSKLK